MMKGRDAASKERQAMIPEFEVRDRHCYMDNAATTAIDQSVVEAMAPYLEERYGNPDAAYGLGSEACGAAETARAQVAEGLGCRPDRVFFTSSGTEANNWAIKGIRIDPIGRGAICASVVEHASVLESIKSVACRFPGAYTYCPIGVDTLGRVNISELREKIESGGVGLVSVQFGNGEVGTLQPVKEIAEICHGNGAVFHCDACQAFGKVPFDVDEYDFDLVSISSHKIHGPMGVGALYVKKGINLEPLLHGEDQEFGMRSGTLAVPSIVGFGAATEISLRRMKDMDAVYRKVDSVAATLIGSCDAVRNGDPVDRLPHILSLTFPTLPGASLLGLLAKKGVCVSMGSRTAKHKSHVLDAMGLGHVNSNHTIRISLSRYTEDIDVVLLTQSIQQACITPGALEYL
jgi:cysteine desulfurase